MAALRPFPFGPLVGSMLRERAARGTILGLPAGHFHHPPADLDLSVRHHGAPAGTPLGPAAGPHTQMAQNLVLAWLAGARVLELKTVQVLDTLSIPRPCIDLRTVGYNVEWSQELRLGESLREYVAGAMAIRILEAEGVIARPGPTRFDTSVGYDLAGVRSPGVAAFLRSMRDATAVVEALRGELTGELARFRDLDFPTALSDSVTVSTFHGCPPDEIERIALHLMREHGFSVTLKLNPTALGPEACRALLNGALGYPDRVPDDAFTRDATWDQVVDFVPRLGEAARALGRSFGVKFSNTLIVSNPGGFLPASEPVAYLSGQPLHVLAMHLVARFRATFGDAWPVSFAGGIDATNFADAVALGLVPVTVCSDLLRPGGYARASRMLTHLEERMRAAGARDLDHWVLAYGHAEAALDDLRPDPALRARALAALAAGRPREVGPDLFGRWVSAARLRNTAAYVAGLATDPRYARAATDHPPRKVGSALALLDCLSCHKCVPVCPNHANLALPTPLTTLAPVTLTWDGAAFVRREGSPLTVTQAEQFATFADFCNACGNCDVFCPEDGGPYLVKPLFFGTRVDFEADGRDGFHLAGPGILGRLGGEVFALTPSGDRWSFRGPGFAVTLGPDLDPASVAAGSVAPGAGIDLGRAHLLRWLSEGARRSGHPLAAHPEAR